MCPLYLCLVCSCPSIHFLPFPYSLLLKNYRISTVCESTNCSGSSPALCMVIYFYFVLSKWCVLILHWVFNMCFSNDCVGHSSLHLLTTSVSFLLKCLFKALLIFMVFVVIVPFLIIELENIYSTKNS